MQFQGVSNITAHNPPLTLWAEQGVTAFLAAALVVPINKIVICSSYSPYTFSIDWISFKYASITFAYCVYKISDEPEPQKRW